jgi:MFS family permease
MLVYATLYSQVYVLLPLSIRHAHLPASTFGYVVALNGVLIVVLQPFTLRWTERLPRNVTLPGAIAVIGAGVGMAPFCRTVWPFVASVVLFSLGELGAAGAFQALVSTIAPPSMRGRYVGTVGTAFGASALIGPPLGAVGFAFSAAFTGVGCMLAGLLAAGAQFRLLSAIDNEESQRKRSS